MRLMEIAPPEAVGKQSRVIWTGREEVVLEGHTGLFSYETKCVRLRSPSGLWTVKGEGLTIDYFGVEDVKIRGAIQSVSVGEENP